MVKGHTWADFADYNTYGTGSRPGLHVKADEARICNECEHEDCIVGDGPLRPDRRRCALERYKANGNGSVTGIPPGYLTVREVARCKGRSVEAIRHAILMGRYPGAKKLGEGKTFRWVIPEESLNNS